MTTPTVSVLLPIWNVARYLDQCFESVLSHTYSGFERPLIDARSTGGSPAVCDSHAARDARVRVVHQANGGLARAGNATLEAARRQVFTFLDGDDWLEPHALKAPLRASTTHKADVVLWPYVREYEDLSPPKRLFDFDERVFGAQKTRHLLCWQMVGLIGEELSAPENADVLITPCAKLYWRDVLERGRPDFVDTTTIGIGDALFNVFVLTRASSAIYLNRYLYHYRSDDASSLTIVYKPALPLVSGTNSTPLWECTSRSMAGEATSSKQLRNRIPLTIIGLGLNALKSGLGKRGITQQLVEILSTPDYQAAVTNLALRWLPPHWRVFFAAARQGRVWLVHALLLRAMGSLRGRRTRARRDS